MKRSHDQWPDINKVDVPEGFGYMTPETENEMADFYSKTEEQHHNSKRSRGEK